MQDRYLINHPIFQNINHFLFQAGSFWQPLFQTWTVPQSPFGGVGLGHETVEIKVGRVVLHIHPHPSGSMAIMWLSKYALQWRHNGLDSVSNHQPHHCLLSRLFGRRSKKTSKLRVTGLCARNSPGTGEFPAQMASYAENVSIWWRHHGVK